MCTSMGFSALQHQLAIKKKVKILNTHLLKVSNFNLEFCEISLYVQFIQDPAKNIHEIKDCNLIFKFSGSFFFISSYKM